MTDQSHTMNYARAVDMTRACLAADAPVFIWGPPGIGKSAIPFALHENVWDVRAVLLDPVDVKGLPVYDEKTNTTRWAPMGELPSDPDAEGILFLDELNAADDAVMKAFLGLVLDRRIGDYHLPKGIRIVAAGNRTSDRTNVRRLPSALANRFVHINIEADLPSWSKWALSSGDIPAEIVAFLSFKTGLLHDFDATRNENPTPRSWETAARFVGNDTVTGELERDALIGTIGEGAAREFMTFLKVYRSLPDLDRIMADPKSEHVPEDVAVIFATVGGLVARVNKKNYGNFIAYLERLEPEYMFFGTRAATQKDPSLSTTKAHTDWTMRNSDMLGVAA